MATVKGKLKTPSGDIIYAETSADKVIMLNAESQPSTVETEVLANRQEIARLAGLTGINIKGKVNGTNSLPVAGVTAGDAYIVDAAGTYGGHTCEMGDWLIATDASTWMAIQTNLVNAVTGPTVSTNDNLAVFDGTSGNALKNSTLTVSGVTTAVSVGSTLDTNKAELAKISEDEDGFPKYNNIVLGKAGIPVVNNGAAAPSNMAEGALYFEKDA